MSNPNGTGFTLSGLPSWIKVPALSVVVIAATLLTNWRVAEWRLNDTVSAVQAEKARNDEQDRRFISRDEQRDQVITLNKRLDQILEEVKETRKRVDDLYRQGIRPR